MEAYKPVRRHLDAFDGFIKEINRNWEEKSKRVISKVELDLDMHQMEAVDWLLLEKNPSYPKEDCKKEGREVVIGLEKKITFGDFEDAK